MNIIYQGRTKKIENGLTVKEALKKEINENKYEVIGCLYNNDYRNLETEVEEGARIELIDISSKEGTRASIVTWKIRAIARSSISVATRCCPSNLDKLLGLMSTPKSCI